MTILLHGFWGQPGDWSPVLHELPLTANVLAPDLYEAGSMDPRHSLKEWTENFLNWLDKDAGSAPVQIVGYSMGARLALNAIVSKPERFSRALLLSGAPVLPAGADRAAFENEWARKFLTQPWEEIEAAWEELAIFKGSERLARRRSQALREMLGLSMTNWSPSKHPFGWAQVADLPASVEWAYGALDQKYMEMAKTLRAEGVRGQITIIPNAGHRLISDAQSFIAQWISRET
jgi:2-succinyl-6-hydroxy-2,4-cyclohexadiene-1-carboxylate synthase